MVLADNISIGYGERVLARGISLRVDKGECVLLCGPNGSGKTTLLRTLASLQEDSVMVPSRIPKVAGFTLKEFILTSLWKENSFSRRLSPDTSRRLDEALSLLGVGHLADRDISTLSDGEFQKGCIASALARDAANILLDEPTAYLDVEGRHAVLSAIRDLSRDRAVIFSSHDILEAGQYCTRTLGLTRDGRFLDSAATEENIFEACFEKLWQKNCI